MSAKKSMLSTIIRLLAIASLIAVLICAVVGIVYWRAGWSSLEQYGNGLAVAGLLAVGLGLLGIRGHWDATHSFGYQYSLTTSKAESWERAQQTLVDFAQAYGFMFVMLLAGSLCIFLGLTLQTR